MKRLHLLELHEQSWMPATWRQLFQKGLGLAQRHLAVYQNATVPMTKLLHKTGAEEVLDLCSGSAGVVMDLVDRLDPEVRPRVVFSDLYPNLSAFERLKEELGDRVDYFAEPVDAFSPPPGTPRVRSIVSALHHFRPAEVRAMLRDAAENADGFIALEGTGRTWINMLLSLPLPLPAAILTAFSLRPWRLHHVLWGLLLPVIPLIALFDGLVSNLRTYTPEELQGFCDEISGGRDSDFVWEVGTLPIPRSPLHSTYVIGWRRDLAERGEAAAQSAPRAEAPSQALRAPALQEA
ncbi:MAG: class I SAM-dependent methyltransferase [Acidobacteriota bacterium]